MRVKLARGPRKTMIRDERVRELGQLVEPARNQSPQFGHPEQIRAHVGGGLRARRDDKHFVTKRSERCNHFVYVDRLPVARCSPVVVKDTQRRIRATCGYAAAARPAWFCPRSPRRNASNISKVQRGVL